MPRVSALIPTYNREEYVGGAIETVLSQTYSDIEAVVINDGSTDNTRDVLAQYSDHERVQVHHNDHNRGISYSFNRAAVEAQGELFCILGDDDRWAPQKISKQVRRMDQLDEAYGVLYTGGVSTKNGKVVDVDRPSWQGDIYPEIIAAWELAPHSSHMIRREAFESVGGFDTDFPRCVDREMCIRLAREYRFDYLSDLLVERIIHSGNISHEPEQANVNKMIWEKYSDEIKQHPEVRRTLKAQWNQMQSTVARDRGDRWQTIQHSWAALRYQPTIFRVLLFILAVLGPSAFRLASSLRRKLLRARMHATTNQFWTRMYT